VEGVYMVFDFQRRPIDALKPYVVHQLTPIKAEGMPVRVLVRPTESGYALWCYSLSDGPHTVGSNAVRHALASALADYIVAEREKELVRGWLRRILRHADAEETALILRYAQAYLGAENGEAAKGRRAKRKRFLVAGLLPFLVPGKPLILEGVLRFRLRAYQRELVRAVEKGIDDYRSECQYRNFVRLLRLFVGSKPPRLPHLHLVYTDERTVRLLDDALRPIEAEAMRAVLREVPDALEDALMSTLVALAPERLTLHVRAANGRTVETLCRVFEGKVSLCPGCALCAVPDFAPSTAQRVQSEAEDRRTAVVERTTVRKRHEDAAPR
jgi:YtxC-like family.